MVSMSIKINQCLEIIFLLIHQIHLSTIGKRIRGNIYLDNIDGVNLWNKELNQEEINSFIQCSPTGNELGLIFTIILKTFQIATLDLSTNNNHGILSGGSYSNSLYSNYSCILKSINGCDSTDLILL